MWYRKLLGCCSQSSPISLDRLGRRLKRERRNFALSITLYCHNWNSPARYRLMKNWGGPITGHWIIPSQPLPRITWMKNKINLLLRTMKSLLQRRKTKNFSRKCQKLRKVTLSMYWIGRSSLTKKMVSRNLRRFNFHQKSLTWYIIVSRRSLRRIRSRVGEVAFTSIRAWHWIRRKISDLFTKERDVTRTCLITSSRAQITWLTFIAAIFDSTRQWNIFLTPNCRSYLH